MGEHPQAAPLLAAFNAQRSQTGREALARALSSTKAALRRLDNDQPVAAQTAAEAALLELLAAMRALGVEPESALRRALVRSAADTPETGRLLVIYPDRVELHAEGECRGAWPVFTGEDVRNYVDMAYELGCRVVHADARQLELF